VKICYVANSVIPSRTANSVHVMKMCQAFAQNGNDVTLVVPDRAELAEADVTDPYDFYDVDPCFKIQKITRKRPVKLWFSTVLPGVVTSRFQPDLIYTRIEWAAFGFASLYNRRCMLELHESPFTSKLRAAAVKSFYRSRANAGMFVITRALAEHIKNALPESAKIHIEPDAVDQAWISRDACKHSARSRLGMDVHEKQLSYVGGLYDGRGIDLIVELAHRCPDVKFNVIGGHDDQVFRWRERTSNVSNLQFFGFVQQTTIFDHLAAADILLMPHGRNVMSSGGSDIADYCSPMKMFEYMSARRPILASSLPVLKEVLHDGQNAILLPPDDVGAWKSAIARLTHDRQLAVRLGQAAYEDVLRFTWDARAARIERQAMTGSR